MARSNEHEENGGRCRGVCGREQRRRGRGCVRGGHMLRWRLMARRPFTSGQFRTRRFRPIAIKTFTEQVASVLPGISRPERTT